MKLVHCALLALLLALATAVRGEEMTAVAEADNAPFVPQAFDEEAEMVGDMDADTAEEQLMDADETADNDEGEDESEAAAEGEAEDAMEDMAEDDAESDAEAESEFEQEDESDMQAEEDQEVEQEEQGEEVAEEGTEFSSFAEVDSEEEGKPRFGRFDKGKKKRSAKSRPIIAPRPIVKPVKFHSERIVAQTTKNEDPEMAKLQLALDAVKEDILSTNKQITDERKWVIAVAKIIASYNDKMKRVESHIVALRKEMKALYRKKKQIENLKLQKALEAKLKEARDELATLTNSLKHVAVKQGELNRSGADLRQTIAGIQSQLAKLRGQQLKKPRPAVKGGKRKGRKGRRGGKGRKGRKGGRGRRGGKGKRCKRGFRFSRNAKRCVPKRR